MVWDNILIIATAAHNKLITAFCRCGEYRFNEQYNFMTATQKWNKKSHNAPVTSFFFFFKRCVMRSALKQGTIFIKKHADGGMNFNV